VKKGITAEREFYASANVKATRFVPEMPESAKFFLRIPSAGKLLLRLSSEGGLIH